MDIERALERAMDADDPGPAFAGRVIAAIKGEASARPAATPARSTRTSGSVVWRALLPLAATVALTFAGVRWQATRAEEARAEAEGVRARAAHTQLMQALRLTGEKLNAVHRAIERSQQ
ncbi:MAG: hypothetical protein ABIT71_07005 [Vicinamibacteraceae bacterium]